MSDVRTPLNLDRLSFKVQTPLFLDMNKDVVNHVVTFYKVLNSPVESGPGHKAFRTKTLKSIIEDVSKIDTPDTESVVKSLKSVLNPSKSSTLVDVSEEFALLYEGLTDPSTDDTSTDDDTPSTDPVE